MQRFRELNRAIAILLLATMVVLGIPLPAEAGAPVLSSLEPGSQGMERELAIEAALLVLEVEAGKEIGTKKEEKISAEKESPFFTQREQEEIERSLPIKTERMDHTITIRSYETKAVTGTRVSNLYVSERLDIKGSIYDIPSRLTLDWDYFDSASEASRLRNIVLDMKDKRFSLRAGDTSTNFSRYIMHGVRYRGINLDFPYGEHKLSLVSGWAPYWLDSQGEYIYPRLVLGAKDRFRFLNKIDMGLYIAYLKDSPAKVKDIDSNAKPIENLQLGLSHAFSVIPGVWSFEGELARSYLDEDVDDGVSRISGNAFYLESLFKKPKFRTNYSYERLGYHFFSRRGVTDLIGLSSGVGSDREKHISSITYTPVKSVYMNLYLTDYENNLSNDPNTVSSEYSLFRATFRLLPPPIFPRITLTASVSDTTNESVTTRRDRRGEDFSLGLFKNVKGINLNAGYSYAKSMDNLEISNDTINKTYRISANTRFFKRVNVQLAQSHTTGYEETMSHGTFRASRTYNSSLNLSSRLWGNSNLSFSQNMAASENFNVRPSQENTTYSSSLNFAWPYTKMLDKKRRISLTPSLSYNYTWDEDSIANYSTLVSRLGLGYQPTTESNVDISLEYRDSENRKNSSFGSEDIRAMLTYTSRLDSEDRIKRPRLIAETDLERKFDIQLKHWFVGGEQDWNTTSFSGLSSSRLAYPLDSEIWSLRGEYKFLPCFSADLCYGASDLKEGKGTDTDWNYTASPTLQTKSTHTSNGKTRFYNFNIYYHAIEEPRYNLDGFLGYQHYRNSFIMTNGITTVSSGSAVYSPFTGLNSRYTITYEGVRLGLRGKLRLTNYFALNSSLAYAPWLKARGYGYWNLRSLVFTQSGGRGEGIDFGLSISYTPLRSRISDLSFELGYSYLWLETEGGRSYSLEEGTTWDVNWDSTEATFQGPYFAIVYRF